MRTSGFGIGRMLAVAAMGVLGGSGTVTQSFPTDDLHKAMIARLPKLGYSGGRSVLKPIPGNRGSGQGLSNALIREQHVAELERQRLSNVVFGHRGRIQGLHA